MTKPKLGVVGVVPVWSQSDNLNTDSNYAYMSILLPKMVEATESTIFLLFFPDPKYGNGSWSYTNDHLQSDRIRFIPWPYDTAMRSSVMGFDPMRFAQIEKNYATTVYWMHQIESGTQFMGGYQQSFNKSGRPTLIGHQHYLIHDSLSYPFEGLFPRLWQQMGGSFACDKVVYHTRHALKMADESFGKYLNDNKMNELRKKSLIIPEGIVNGDEPIAPAAEKGSIPVFVYNHRFENYKQPHITAEVLEILKQEFEFKVWATQVAKQRTDRMPIDEAKFAPHRKDYLNNIAVPAINTINSIHETMCLSILDSMMLGHIVVVPNSVTFPEIVPKDYPYLFNTQEEQLVMLRHILHTWPNEYNKWREILANHARTTYNLNTYVDRYLKVIDSEEEKRRNTDMKPHVYKGMMEIFDSMRVGELVPPKKINNRFQNKLNLGTQAMPPRRIVREALHKRDDIDIVWDKGIHLVRR